MSEKTAQRGTSRDRRCGLVAKRISIRKRIQRLFLAVFLVLLLSMTPCGHASAFCTDNKTLDDKVEVVLTDGSYATMTQGFCIAENYMIRTRWQNNGKPTIYQVIDLDTMKEVNHFEFATGHSNSLTYNPDLKEVVCVTDGQIFRFSFYDGVLEEKDVITDFQYHFVKCTYVSAVEAYYISTGVNTFVTLDFMDIRRAFTARVNGTHQGIGSDGEFLYVTWSKPGAEEIDIYNTKGELVDNLKISHAVCHEAEEVDFYNGYMYINENLSVPGRVLRVPMHYYEETGMREEPTCVKDGFIERKCTMCGRADNKVLAATGKHEEGEAEVLKEATCTEDGETTTHCTMCGEEMSRETVKALGHDFEEYEVVAEATFQKAGKKERTCKACGEKESEEIPKMKLSVGNWWKYVLYLIQGK